ncbi:MAG: HD domain-containing phosphohydrolase [Myxococcota bacterium]
MTEPSPRPRVLLVDDDRNLLQAVRRHQHRHFDLTLADDPLGVVEKLEESEPFAVAVSDLQMPGMDGIELLRRVQQSCPDTVRIMLTGNADLEAAKRAVNDGHIFRFLTKPCAPEELKEAIEAGVEMHRLVVAERELLEQTLHGAVEVLTESLGLVHPAAFGRAARVRSCVRDLVSSLEMVESWEFEVAAMLSQVGCVSVPPDVLEKAYAGRPLSAAESRMVAKHPEVGSRLIRAIPRLEPIADMIRLQQARFDGRDAPTGVPSGEALPLGARLLKLAIDLDALESRGVCKLEALQQLQARRGEYDPHLLDALAGLERLQPRYEEREVLVKGLCVGMTLAEPVRAESGLLIVAAGQQVTEAMVQRLQNWVASSNSPVQEPIRVRVPVTDDQQRKQQKVAQL